MQDDVMFSCLTVWETLWVAARLRLPSTFSMQKKRELAESVISELGKRTACLLRPYSDTGLVVPCPGSGAA